MLKVPCVGGYTEMHECKQVANEWIGGRGSSDLSIYHLSDQRSGCGANALLEYKCDIRRYIPPCTSLLH